MINKFMSILWKNAICILAFLYMGSCYASTCKDKKDQQNQSITIIEHKTILEKPETQVHFPFLLEHENGNWYMTYREGPHSKPGGDRVQCVMSTNRGETWQPWQGLEPEPLLRFFRTELNDGSWISHRYKLKSYKKGKGTAIIMRSNDGGATWNKTPAAVTGLPFNKNSTPGLWGHIIQLPDGKLLCGIYGEKGDKERGGGHKKFIAGVIQSDDNGKNWRYLSHLCTDQSLGDEGPDEMDICRLDSGDLIAMIRTGTRPGSHMIQVRSKDDGRTWQDPTDMGIIGVSPQLLLLDNGVLVCSFGTRDVHVMADKCGTGKKWSKPVLIYKGQGTGYTDLQAHDDQTFRLVFDESSFRQHQPGGNRIVRVVVCVPSQKN